MNKTFITVGAVVIFILAAVAFVFAPAKVGGAAQRDAVVFGKYDGKPIELKAGTEFAQAVNNIQQSYQAQGINIDETNYIYVYSYAFNAAVQSIAAKNAVAGTGYEPGDTEVSRHLLKLPYFLDENGNYSPEIARMYSDEQKEELRASIKEGLVGQRFQDDLFGSAEEFDGKSFYGLKSSKAEGDFLAGFGSKKRAFGIISFNKSNYPDSEVMKFAEANKDTFEKFDISAISFADEATANKVQKQLTGGEIKFEDAVKEEYSEKYFTDANGKITASYKYQVKGILADEASLETIKALAKDAFSGVVKTSSGYTVFRKDGENSQADFNDKNTFDVVKKYITSNESGKIEDYFIETAKNVTADATLNGFDNVDISAIDGAEKVTVPAFSLNYGGVSLADKLPTDTAKQLSSAVNNESFWEKAFGMKVGSYSEPIVLGNYVVVLNCTGEETDEAAKDKLESLKGEIVSYDQASAQSTLLDSDKVENNVWNAYAKLHMNK
jgi:hypothetical protein